MDFFKKGLSKLSAAAESAAAQARAGVSGASTSSSARDSSSRAGNSGPAGGGGSGLGPEGADPASLRDVRFNDRDPNESHVQFLWTVFEGAPEASQQQDEALESFLEGFNACFDGWFPPPSDGSNGAGGDGTIVGCADGHPTAVLRGLVSSLHRVHAKLEAALALGASGAQIRTDGPNALQRAAGLALLNACVVATRSAHNRAWFIRLGLLDALTALLKLAMHRLNVLGNLAAMRHPGGRGGSSMGTAAEVAAQLGVLELLCAHGASVLSNFLDADLRFGSIAGGFGMSDDGSAAADRSGTHSADRTLQNSTVAPRSPAAESPAVKPLLECGGLTALVEMIRIQRLLHRAPTGSEAAARSLEGLLLRTLCAALAGSAAAQHSLRGAGGLEMLIEGIGIDATGTHDAGPAPPGGRAGEVTDGDLNGGDTAGDNERRHHYTGDYCAREDLTEFISLLAMALRVPTRWTRGAVDEYDEALVEPSASRLAHLDAAAGYLELIPHREAAGDVGADRGFTSRLTHEQLSIVSADVKKDEVLHVRAFAGTGKTTTLLEYVKRRPGYQFAYITFNRSVMEEASTKFPKLNVKCLNFHKMAYAKFGFLYRGEKFLRGTLRQYHVSKAIGVNDSRALFAIRVLNEFLKSADLAVELKHAEAIRAEVSTKDWNKVYGKSNVKEKLGSQSPEENLVELVKKLWDKMLNPEDSSFPMTDAGYLKRYQLACRREHNPVRLDVNFDILMLDEAQDAAPVMADIILSQNECGKILVGDPHQEIYSFMGAKNAMATVAATVDKSKIVERRLTRSFRFGYEIADVANTLLRLKGETTCLIGSRRDLPDPVWSSWSDQEEVSAVHCLPRPKDADGVTLTLQSYAPGYTATLCTRLGDRPIREQGRQLVVLCRSNASVFDVASRILNLGIKDLKLGFVGGLEGQRLGQLMDIWRLARQSDDELDAITDYFVSRFVKEYLKALENGVKDPEPPFQALKSSAKLSNDLEMQTKISIVEKYRGNLPELIEKLKKVDVGTNPSDLKCANYLLSTAHRAKGLEFDHVLLWNDFLAVNQCSPIEWDSNGHATLFAIAVGNMLDEAEVVGADDLNLVYVAATRAKQRLIVSDALKHLITAPRCRFAVKWYLQRDTNLPTTEMIAEDLAPYEVLAQRRGGPAHFATLRCATNTCDRCGDQSDVFSLPAGSVQADKVDNAPTLGMEVRYGRIRQGMADTDTRFAKADPHAVSTVPMIAPSESYAFRHNRRMCGRCVRTFAVSRRGAERYLDDDTAGAGVERTWVDDTILENFFHTNNRVNNIDPIEGMSMMDIASVCAAERRARGEPWRGKDAAGQPRRMAD